MLSKILSKTSFENLEIKYNLCMIYLGAHFTFNECVLTLWINNLYGIQQLINNEKALQMH